MGKKKKKNKTPTDNQNRTITLNRKARHDYHILDDYHAGLVLVGSEIKSIRAGRVNISEGFVQERNGELWLMGVHIAPYKQGKTFGHNDPFRPRKLLLHRREITEITERIRDIGFSCVPLRLYLERGLAKVEIAVARGKKNYDKRQDIAKRDAERKMRRALKNY